MIQIYLILITLGIVQGIAEFLPISSSGHLVLLEQIHCFKTQLTLISNDGNLFINVALHIATLIAVVIFLWKDIIAIVQGAVAGIREKNFSAPAMKQILYILCASIPAGIIGALFNDYFEKAFSSALTVFILLIINGIILISTKKIMIKDRKIEETGVIRSLIIGFFQAVAIFPGISRSGMTITGGMLNGLEPVESARFSFLMAIPVIAGAGLLEGIKVFQADFPQHILLPLAISMVITIVVALFSLKILFALVKRIKIDIFGYYTIIVGLCGLAYLLLF